MKNARVFFSLALKKTEHQLDENEISRKFKLILKLKHQIGRYLSAFNKMPAPSPQRESNSSSSGDDEFHNADSVASHSDSSSKYTDSPELQDKPPCTI